MANGYNQPEREEPDYELEEARYRETDEQARQDFFESWGGN